MDYRANTFWTASDMQIYKENIVLIINITTKKKEKKSTLREFDWLST